MYIAQISTVSRRVGCFVTKQCCNYTRVSTIRQTFPKMRYFVLMFFVLSGALYYAGNSVTRKKPRTSFSSQRELEAYELSTGIRRRHKLIPSSSNDQYTFYAAPLCSELQLKRLVSHFEKNPEGKQILILDPESLISQELENPERKYHQLLHDIVGRNKPFPPGLLTALLKQEISFLLNTRAGTFDTCFVLKNFPSSIDEAIKFENDVLDIKLCLVFQNTDLNPEERRISDNVVGYFDIVGKSLKFNER